MSLSICYEQIQDVLFLALCATVLILMLYVCMYPHSHASVLQHVNNQDKPGQNAVKSLKYDIYIYIFTIILSII